MSFTALLLPLQLQLTYYQYLAGKNSSPRAFLPGALPVGTRCKHRAAGRPLTLRVTQVPAPLPTLPRLYSSLHTPVQLFLDLLTSLDLSGRRPPPSSPPLPVSSVVWRLTQQSSQQAHTPTHLGRILGSQLVLHPALLRQLQHNCARPVPPPPLQLSPGARPRAAPQGLPKSPSRCWARP